MNAEAAKLQAIFLPVMGDKAVENNQYLVPLRKHLLILWFSQKQA